MISPVLLAARCPVLRQPADNVDLGGGVKQHVERVTGEVFYSYWIVQPGLEIHATGATPAEARGRAILRLRD